MDIIDDSEAVIEKRQYRLLARKVDGFVILVLLKTKAIIILFL